jgi:hypothetical protein
MLRLDFTHDSLASSTVLPFIFSLSFEVVILLLLLQLDQQRINNVFISYSNLLSFRRTVSLPLSFCHQMTLASCLVYHFPFLMSTFIHLINLPSPLLCRRQPTFFTAAVKEELLRNPNLMPFGLWLFTVLCVAIAIIFGLVSSIFAIINTVMAPGEVISGIHGLFLWNGMGGEITIRRTTMLLRHAEKEANRSTDEVARLSSFDSAAVLHLAHPTLCV